MVCQKELGYKKIHFAAEIIIIQSAIEMGNPYIIPFKSIGITHNL
jgi:hypothetical protein